MTPKISVLVPAYNEAENLGPLADELVRALDGLGRDYEVVIVDDGSRDGTFEQLRSIVASRPRFKAIRLARNFGQTAALAAAFRHCGGDVVVTLDADLQNDPADIGRLVSRLEEGCDCVSGWRKERRDPYLTRVLPSRLANALISRITRVPLHDYGCALKAYRREHLESIHLVGEMHRFLPAFVGIQGGRVAELPVNHRPRLRGESKYGLMRTGKVLLDLLTVKFMEDYLSKPIYVFGGGGILLGAVSVVLAAVTLYKKFYLGTYVKDQPLFQVSIFFGLVAVQLILLGLLAEILIRIYYDIKDKPPYFVRDTLGFPPPARPS